MGLNFSDKINEVSAEIKSPEQMIGKGLIQPFNGANAGSRKIMYSTHRDHVFPLMTGEKAIIETGYEIKFGDFSSSITKADSDYDVIAKVSKFSFCPNHHYYLIVRDRRSKKLDMIERISYQHITECYGYLYNNEYLDSLNPGSVIKDDSIVQKSLAFDEYNNRKDGVNFNVAYMALDDNMEDSVIFSDVAAAKLTSPLIKPVSIMINENDIPLNIYGNSDVYKSFPDIGEDIKDARLIAFRKEKKEESLYMQSVDRLRDTLMTDEKFQLHGKVIDINIYCNNPDLLEGHYYSQFKLYYNELQRMSSEIVNVIMPYVVEGYELSYDLEHLYAISKRTLNHDQYIDKRLFSFIKIDMTVLEELPLGPGDKTSNRYGGKGVISNILPQCLMPRFNLYGKTQYADVILNSSTMINRENVGQSIESSLTHIAAAILDRISKGDISVEDSYAMIRKYVSLCSPEQAVSMDRVVSNMTREELMFFIESITRDQSIHLSIKPISEAMTIDKIAEIYKEFPWIKQNDIEVPIMGSDGQYRYIKARRPIVIGKQYMFRLKQFAEEKYSATSLSSTNIRNENTKSKASKEFKELYSNTPIRFGNMETNQMDHLGQEEVIANMMIHSLSPQARRLVEKFCTDDPYNVDIKLDSNSRNRNAEIVQTYLKTMGRRLVHIKKKKKRDKIAFSPIYFERDPAKKSPISFVPENMRDGFDYEKDFKDRQVFEKKKAKRLAKSPVFFEGIDVKRLNKDK